jgi:hypothetical protein
MSRWEILRSALKNGQRDACHQNSIHRFQGFQKLKKTKCLWSGFHLKLILSEINNVSWINIMRACEEYLQNIDCTECQLDLEFMDALNLHQFVANDSSSGHYHSLVNIFQQYLNQCGGKGCFHIEEFPSIEISVMDEESLSVITEIATFTHQTIELKSDDSKVIRCSFRVRHLTMLPLHKVIEYYKYELPANDVSGQDLQAHVFTREPPKNKKISSQDLLSNQLYGVDNTGNICVWPSEPLMLYVFTRSRWMVEMIQGKRVLEVGGGMTGLVGLGLAALELCSEVTITDGHPNCVANQVGKASKRYNAKCVLFSIV